MSKCNLRDEELKKLLQRADFRNTYSPYECAGTLVNFRVLLRLHSSALQARIDELMFEYCPDEMTEEQLENYRKSVGVVDEQLP